MSTCSCDIPQRHERKCFNCNLSFVIEMNFMFRKIYCPVHKMIYPCGYPVYICPECEDLGWVGMGGDGGGCRAFNKNTKEYKYPPEPDSESDDEELF